MHVYSPGAAAVSPRGQNVDVNRKVCSLYPFVASFKEMSSKSEFMQFFFMILYMYSGPGQGQTAPGDKVVMSTEMSYHFIHLLQVSKKFLQSLILYNFFHDLIHVYSPRAAADSPRGQNFDVNRKVLSLYPSVASFKEMSSKSDFIHVYIPRAGADSLRGQNFDVNRRKVLPLYSFVAILKEMSLKSDFIQFFS